MPNFDLSNQPQYPLVTIDTDDAIENNQISSLFNNQNGVTLCVRSATGHPNRGGYFFCISKTNNNNFNLETIEGVYVDCFTLESLVKFINHSSGKKFDPDLLDYCQNSINFRND